MAGKSPRCQEASDEAFFSRAARVTSPFGLEIRPFGCDLTTLQTLVACGYALCNVNYTIESNTKITETTELLNEQDKNKIKHYRYRGIMTKRLLHR